MAATQPACSVEDAGKSGLAPETICAAFMDGFLADGGDPDAIIVLKVEGATTVHAGMAGPDGAMRDPLTFDVMDTGLSEAVLKGFGGDFARLSPQG